MPTYTIKWGEVKNGQVYLRLFDPLDIQIDGIHVPENCTEEQAETLFRREGTLPIGENQIIHTNKKERK